MNIFQMISNFFSNKTNHTEKTVSYEMQTALDGWLMMYQHQDSTPNNSHSLDLPYAIASEFSRLVLSESEIKLEHSDFLNIQMQNFFRKFRENAETAFALGSMVFKPYVSGNQILVDMIRADRYAPVSFDDSGAVTSAVFMARKVIGKQYYTRLETHTWNAEHKTYLVENRAYCSLSDNALGWQCDLHSVAGWEHLQDMQTLENIEKPLFSVFKIPASNTIDLDSPLGVSVIAHAVDLIHEANAQWARIQWEFQATEIAIDASEDLFRKDAKTGKFHNLPVGSKRLFRQFCPSDNRLADDLQVFSPAIRDTSLFNGLNHILQRIEFNCGLAYGTLSEPSEIEKTAEEIRTSRQRSYVQISRMQMALQNALEQLAYAMQVYSDLYELAPSGNAELSCTWGDSVLEDTDKEFNRRLQLVTSGNLKPEKLLAWYFGCSEEKAISYLPDMSNDGGLFSGDV